MDFNHKHYVPCLRWKQGEYMAIEGLKAHSRGLITPLIEAPEIGFDFEERTAKKTIDEHLKPFAKRVNAKWGRPCFVDLIHLPQKELMADGRHPVIQVFDELRTFKCSATPVTGLERDRAHQEAIKNVISQDKRGVCIRISLSDVTKSTLKSMIDALMAQLKVGPNECDLILDIGAPNFEPIDGITKLVQISLSRLPYQIHWRTVTIIGTSFPETMAEVRRSPEAIPRWEWLLYKKLSAILREQRERIPTFGDYGISHKNIPQLDMRLVKPSATIRYTIDDAWFIVKGVNVRTPDGFEQYRNLSQMLIRSRHFRGPKFSMGDAFIHNCALGEGTTGGLPTWRKVGTNQHMEKVVHDVANLFGT